MHEYPRINIPDIDEQHGHLVCLMDLLTQQLVNEDESVVLATLCNITFKLHDHFVYEELHMGNSMYPLLDVHRAEHTKLRQNMLQMLYFKEDNITTEDIIKRLMNILLVHIGYCDMDYSNWLAKQK